MKIVSIPVAVHNNWFKPQLDLFWYHHKKYMEMTLIIWHML